MSIVSPHRSLYGVSVCPVAHQLSWIHGLMKSYCFTAVFVCPRDIHMQEADIEGVARAVSVRQHARETIKAALQKGWQVHVLSVNWSAALIRAVLAGIPSRIDREGADNLTLDAGDQQAVVIHANSLEMQFGISTGVRSLISLQISYVQ